MTVAAPGRVLKGRWRRKPCGCVRAVLPQSGRVGIRCERHRFKPAKRGRTLCYFGPDGIVRRG